MAFLLDKTCSEVEQQIWSHQETQLSQVQELQDEVQQDMNELRKGISELDTLEHAEFLQLTQKTVRIHTGLRHKFDEVTPVVSALRDKLQLTLEEGLANVSQALGPDEVLPAPDEPSTREEFLKYSSEITLDPNTTSKYLSLSDGNRKATVMGVEQNYPDHPDRFTYWDQVLSRESLTGRCYWEVERSGHWVRIAVSYRDIQREGNSTECGFGFNDKSWALECKSSSYSFRFNSVESQVSGPASSRIGVYLDYNAGVLSFYSISLSTMSLLHRVQTTFTQPLYAGVWNYWRPGDTAHFPKLN
ncbi:hypothetical protein NQD34_012740 [Periophthalmus magnuspinnatus]|nr:hypothetical protein NQD34_012740 [Periophthalmus magnuspinnatus]